MGLASDEEGGGEGASASHVTAKALEDKRFGAESSDDDEGGGGADTAGAAASSSSQPAAAAPAAGGAYGAGGGDGYDSMDEFIEKDDDGSGDDESDEEGRAQRQAAKPMGGRGVAAGVSAEDSLAFRDAHAIFGYELLRAILP